MSQPLHDVRRYEREQQSRLMVAPLMDFTVLPRATESHIRLESGTRETVNNRLWDTTVSIPTIPISHAQPWVSTTSRTDERSYLSHNQTQLNEAQLYRQGIDTQHHAREYRGSVTEQRSTPSVQQSRITERLYQHVWIPPHQQNQIVESQLAAAEALRPSFDDYRITYKK